MGNPNLKGRKQALDDAFFGDKGESSLIEQLRIRLNEEAAKEDLADASAIHDEEVLARLASLGIRADTLAALTLIPLLRVAWADGVMEDKEKQAVLSGAVTAGVRRGSPSHQLLEIWLVDRPPPDLVKAWTEFIGCLCRELDEVEREQLREKILMRSRSVAEAAGDLLRDNSMVSPEEEAMLEELERAFRA